MSFHSGPEKLAQIPGTLVLKIATRNDKNRIAKNSTAINSSSTSVDLSNNGWKNGSAKSSIL